MKILLVRLGALGDIVHALPVAAALRERYPDAQVDWLVDAKHAAVLDLVPVISRRVVVDSRRWGASFGAVRALRRERYDAAVDLQGLVKSAAFARMSGAARVIGFARAHLREQIAAVVLFGGVRSGERHARHRQEHVGPGPVRHRRQAAAVPDRSTRVGRVRAGCRTRPAGRPARLRAHQPGRGVAEQALAARSDIGEVASALADETRAAAGRVVGAG